MKNLSYILVVVILLASCTPSQSQINTAIAKTQAAWTPTITHTITEPTETPTTIPLSNLDLSSLLVQTGDLPAGFTGAQIGSIMPDSYNKLHLPAADLKIYQQFAQNGGAEFNWGVAVFVYLSKDSLQPAFTALVGGFMESANYIDGIGVKAAYYAVPDVTELAFYDCNFVVDFMFGIVDKTSAENYAIRIDKRLRPILCPYQAPQ